MIRKARKNDIERVAEIYDLIHEEEEQGRLSIGWARKVYPTKQTAEAALDRGDLFVMEEDIREVAIADGKDIERGERRSERIVAAAIINRIQVPVYGDVDWGYKEAIDDEVMVLHTLVVSPLHFGKGYGKTFVAFYEEYASENACPYLRMDTNSINSTARKMYRQLGYTEAGIIPCVFNGIEGVQLVCLEKKL